MTTNQTPVCSCAIGICPPTTSMIDCAEHGMPQNLEDAAYPGSTPTAAIIIDGPEGSSVIAPLYTQEQVEQAKAIAAGLGFKPAPKVFAIHSLASLEAIAASVPPRSIPSLQQHRHGCIYAPRPHPGDCYVEDPGKG